MDILKEFAYSALGFIVVSHILLGILVIVAIAPFRIRRYGDIWLSALVGIFVLGIGWSIAHQPRWNGEWIEYLLVFNTSVFIGGLTGRVLWLYLGDRGWRRIRVVVGIAVGVLASHGTVLAYATVDRSLTFPSKMCLAKPIPVRISGEELDLARKPLLSLTLLDGATIKFDGYKQVRETCDLTDDGKTRLEIVVAEFDPDDHECRYRTQMHCDWTPIRGNDYPDAWMSRAYLYDPEARDDLLPRMPPDEISGGCTTHQSSCIFSIGELEARWTYQTWKSERPSQGRIESRLVKFFTEMRPARD